MLASRSITRVPKRSSKRSSSGRCNICWTTGAGAPRCRPAFREQRKAARFSYRGGCI